jgi:hypothetical protein
MAILIDRVAPSWPGVGRILTSRRLVYGSLLILGIYVPYWLVLAGSLAGALPSPPAYEKIDFAAFWAASSLALKGTASAAYEGEAIWREQLQVPGDDTMFQPWRNPPVYFFFVLPLSLLPFAAALWAWVAATAAIALSAVRRMSSDRTVLLLVLASPAFFGNVAVGQNGLLTAGLLAWGMLLLRDRPLAAGAVLGLMAFKPQFFPLVVLALIAGGHRRALIASLASVGIVSLASLALFGLASWEGFFHMATTSGNSLYGGELEPGKMQSISASALLLGLPVVATQALQAGVALAAAAFVVWLWRRDVDLEYRAAGLAAAVLLATPYSYLYDLTLLGLAGLWLALAAQRHGWRPGQAEVVTLAWLTPLAYRLLGISVAPIVLLALIVVLVRCLSPRMKQRSL